MRLIRHIFLLLLTTFAAAAAARAADNGQSSLVPSGRETVDSGGAPVSFQAILVIASDDGPTDPDLSAYEPTLKRVLRFKSYRRVGGGASRPLAAAQEATIPIGAGYDLDVWVKWMTDREVEFGVRGFKDRLTVANTSMTRPRPSTTVVGGWTAEDGKSRYVVILLVK